MDEYRMIDGGDLIAFLSGFVSFIKKVFRYILTSIGRHIVIFITTLAIILGMGMWHWYHARPYYSGEMACRYHELNKKAYGELLHTLGQLAQDHSYHALATALKISPDQAASVVSIEGKNMSGSMLYEDITQNNDDPIYVDVKATDSSVLRSLQPVILTYLNTSSQYLYTAVKKDSMIIAVTEANIIQTVGTYDSLLAAYAVQLKNGIVPYSSSIDSRFEAMLKSRDSLESRRSELKLRAVELKTPVELLHGFVPSDGLIYERNRDLELTILAAIVIACLAAILARMLHDVKEDTRAGGAAI